MSEHDPMDDAKVSATHRALRDTPSPALDARILAAATAAVTEDAAAAATRARWRRWVPAVGLAASVTLALVIVMQLFLLNGPRPGDPVILEDWGMESVPASAVPGKPKAAPEAPKENAPALDLPKVDAPMAAGGAYSGTPAAAPPAPTAAERAAVVEAIREEVAADAKQSLERVEVTGARARRTQQADDSVAPAAAAKFGEAPETAEAWRKRIAELRAAGKAEDAEREQGAFCVAYPDEAECKKQ